jgi:hypothetical protein
MPRINVKQLDPKWFEIRGELGNVSASKVQEFAGGVESINFNNVPLVKPKSFEAYPDFYKKITRQIQVELDDDDPCWLNFKRGQLFETPTIRLLKKYIPDITFQGDGGFFQHDEISWIYASPDDLSIDGKIGVESKSPEYNVHETIPSMYLMQCICQIHSANLDYVLFVSYCAKTMELRIFKITSKKMVWDFIVRRLEKNRQAVLSGSLVPPTFAKEIFPFVSVVLLIKEKNVQLPITDEEMNLYLLEVEEIKRKKLIAR